MEVSEYPGRYVLWDRILRDVKVCADCGALVTGTEAHDRLHAEIARSGRAASSFGPIA